MKKLIAIAVVLALVAGAAFAADGIELQAWGRGAFSPLKVVTAKQVNGEVVALDKDGKPDPNGVKPEDETYAGMGYSWGGDLTRVDIRINGNSDYVGFGFNGTFENYGFNDNAALIWVKPFGSDILKLTVGQFVDETLRGKIGCLDGGFSNFVLGDSPEEDSIFQSFAVGKGRANPVYGDSAGGFMLSSAPVDGLFLGLLVKGALGDGWNAGGNTVATLAYKYMHLGVGYNIANIGHIRLQYIGGWSGSVDLKDKDQVKYFTAPKFKADGSLDSLGSAKNLARVEAAFALTAVEGLLVDLGGKFWFPLELKNSDVGDYSISKGVDIGLGATFNTGAIGIGARVDITGLGAYADGRGKDNKKEVSATTIIRLVPTFGLGEATLGLNVALKLQGAPKDKDGKDAENWNWSQIGFGAFVSKGLGNGSVKAGLSYTLAPNSGKDNKAYGISVFQIPIILEYAFF